ncbi:MAG: Jag N-terminal domain-containing protein [Anaerovoracaceae bacterium]
MADFSEKWGTDVEAAVKLALDDLRLTIDEVDVTVLEEPSRGFFGIGSKLALVRVEKKKSQAQGAAEKKDEHKKEEKTAVEKAEKAQIKKTETPKKNISKRRNKRRSLDQG